MKRIIELTWKHARRTVIMVVGVIIFTIGIAALFLPFLPAVVILPLSLAVLATEFLWARRLLNRIQEKAGFRKRPNHAQPCVPSAPRD